MKFSMIDALLGIFISLVALSSRLWTIAHPSTIVFDEVHFGNFSKFYILNEFHFDIHPPLGKMIMGYIAHLTGYKGTINFARKLGTYYTIEDSSFMSQRQTPAIFSAFVAPLLFYSMRNLGISVYPSFAAGIMIALDSSMITEAKFILSDGVLHFFTALHIFAFTLFLRTQDPYHVLFAGITLGLAASCKLTALGLVAVDGISQVVWIFVCWPSFGKIVLRAFLLLFPLGAVIVLVWVLHFAYTPYTGFKSFRISKEDSHTLISPEKINTTYWGNRVSKSALLPRILRWNLVMNKVNMRSNCPHPWSSSPKYWPFLMDKMLKLYSDRSHKQIFCFGLPVAYYFSTIGLFLAIILLPFRKSDWKNLLLIMGWAVSYFPFLRIPRTMFHYHYLVPLMFAVMNLYALIDCMFRNNRKAKGYVVTLILILNVLCFFFFTPLIYGTSCPNCMSTRIWNNRWLKGPPKPLTYYGKDVYNTTQIIASLPPV